MALTRAAFVALAGVALPLLFFMHAEAGEAGVSYGTVANNLPDPGQVVPLLKQNGITMVRIYDANDNVLRSLANTGIKVMVMLPNENVADAARSPAYALSWVRSHVAAYPATQINGLAVGNEVFKWRPDLNLQLVPAMRNIHDALAQLRLDGTVKVSTPVAFDALKPSSFPPSAARFKDEIARPVMKPMLDFLQSTGSYLTVNIYPYFTYTDNPTQISLDYALGNAKNVVPADNLKYTSLLDAQLDATYHAMEALGNIGASLRLSESGWPSGGRRRPGGRRRRLLDAASDAASVANAQTYNNNLINRVLSGNTGTPYHPDADLDVYIFALFNENQKGGGSDDVEQNFGLFYPNMQKVYPFSFQGDSSAGSWCAARPAVGDKQLQGALDYACGHGADCSATQPGGTCFYPNTVVARASYAFNDYYQRNGRADGTCDFSGAAAVVHRAPDICWSWCVPKPGVGQAWLQAGMQYACGHGADCSAIQPGAACFQPDTVVAHASYAFNSYYQNKGRANGTCDFSGAATIVYQPQKIGSCALPPSA